MHATTQQRETVVKSMLAIFLIALSSAAHASDATCVALAQKVLTAKGGDSTVYGVPPCKAMPDDPSKTIMVLDNEIIVARNDSGEIISHGAIGTTPQGSNPSSIDTAPYWLSPTVRAFGVRFHTYYPHYHAGEDHETLNMYVIEGGNIRTVMELLIVRLEISGEEVCKDEANEQDCTQSHYTDNNTISIAKTRHNGYADLIVKTDNHDVTVKSNKLIYDTHHYVGPADLMEDPVDAVQ
jgi:hypothetical protein